MLFRSIPLRSITNFLCRGFPARARPAHTAGPLSPVLKQKSLPPSSGRKLAVPPEFPVCAAALWDTRFRCNARSARRIYGRVIILKSVAAGLPPSPARLMGHFKKRLPVLRRIIFPVVTIIWYETGFVKGETQGFCKPWSASSASSFFFASSMRSSCFPQ